MRRIASPARARRKASPKRAAPFACHLVIMVKEPVAGRVKTRLARDVGVSAAMRFYRATLRAVIGRLARQPFWQTILSVSPDTAVSSVALPNGLLRISQGNGDLGARMQRPMRRLQPGPVCVVGSDIPGIGVSDVRQAFRQLGRCDVVFGPAEDGGFWLVGMRRRPRVINPYASVAWSRPDTLAAVEARLVGSSVGHTSRLGDVDSGADLKRLAGLQGRLILPPRSKGMTASKSVAR